MDIADRLGLSALRYFATLAEELHFGRAAARLGIAQPFLSQKIRALEEAVGSPLFLRTSRRVELTEAGAAFLESARKTLGELQRGVHRVHALGRGELGTIDIGYAMIGMLMVVPDLLKTFRSEYPRVRLSLHEISTVPGAAQLRQGDFDVGFLSQPVTEPGLRIHRTWREPFCAAVPSDHPLAKTRKIRLRDLAREPFVSVVRWSAPDMYDRMMRDCAGGGRDALHRGRRRARGRRRSAWWRPESGWRSRRPASAGCGSRECGIGSCRGRRRSTGWRCVPPRGHYPRRWNRFSRAVGPARPAPPPMRLEWNGDDPQPARPRGPGDTMQASLMILVAGPYRSGTGDDPARLAENLRAMEAVALPLFRAGHIPVVGEWLALPLVTLAGSQRVGDAAFDEIFHPIAERLLARCDAVLRVGGASQGADLMVRIARDRGLAVFSRLEDVPGCG